MIGNKPASEIIYALNALLRKITRPISLGDEASGAQTSLSLNALSIGTSTAPL